MKNIKIMLFVLTAVLCISGITACSPKDQEKKEREPNYLTILDGTDMRYGIVRPDRASDEESEAGVKLRTAFKEKFQVTPDLSTDWIKRGETLEEGLLEILVGKTNRPESQIILNSLNGDMYAVAVLNEKIVICASSDEFLDDAIDYFIETYITPAENKVEIEATTNSIAVKTATGWLMSRTLEIEILATQASNSEIEIIAAVDEENFTDVGFEVKMNGIEGEPVRGLKSKGESYTLGGVTYNAADKNKKSIVSAKIGGIDASTLTKIEITPYVVEFGNTLYGLEAFACAYDGNCETISSVEVKDGIYQITNPAELYVFADYVNRGHREINASLLSDVDMGNVEWTPIGSTMMSFKGTFEGNKNTIKNLYIVGEGECEDLGFFGCIGTGSTVQNVTFSDIYVFADQSRRVGIIAGENRGLIKDCAVSGTVSTSDKSGNAGTGYAEKGTMDGIGGIVGVLNGKYLTSIENCTFSGLINIDAQYVTFVGGIAGKSLAISGDIINCVNSANINCISDYPTSGAKNDTGLGGIVGSLVNGTVAGSFNEGTITGSGATVGYVGGVVGNIIGMGQAVECHNSGNISTSYNSSAFIQSYVGGIVGVFSGNTISDGMALRCFNTGEINAADGYAAGIAGQIFDCRSYIMYCYNVGKITANEYAAGICANAGNNRSFIMNCYNAGKVDANNASGIIGFAGAQFNESYTTQYSSVDTYINYTGNYFLKNETATAYAGSKTSEDGGVESAQALADAVLVAASKAPNLVSVHEYFVADSGNINGGLPVFEYQNDISKATASVDYDLYTVHSSSIEPDGSRYYYVNRYTDYLEDNNQKLTAAEFEAHMNDTVETTHNIINEEGAIIGKCDCAVFKNDHHFTIKRWTEILDDVEKNLQGVADWANRGEIRHIGYLLADADQDSGSVAVTWRLINDSKTLGICFNVTYYKNGRNDGATVHEMAHAQLLDGPCEGYIAEGDADYVKFNYYEGTDLKNYRWKEDDFQGAYAPTASCYSFLARMYGREAARVILSFQTVLKGDGADGWPLAFGATYQEIWDLFGVAGRWDVDAYFED